MCRTYNNIDKKWSGILLEAPLALGIAFSRGSGHGPRLPKSVKILGLPRNSRDLLIERTILAITVEMLWWHFVRIRMELIVATP